MNLNEDDIELTDPSTQPYQYKIFVNNCNDYIGSQIVETLRNDHLIEVNPNIIVGSVNPTDRSAPPEDIQIIKVTQGRFSFRKRPHTIPHC
jgi:hypothetical protein